MSRAARLWGILQSLCRCRRPVSAAEFGRELGVSERTIYRDLATLAVQGVTVEGTAGPDFVLRSGKFLPPLTLGRNEADAVPDSLKVKSIRMRLTRRDAPNAGGPSCITGALDFGRHHYPVSTGFLRNLTMGAAGELARRPRRINPNCCRRSRRDQPDWH